tara:strand:- start:8542 stop:8814 length:273 start_codon:yes stop_codon:yes gene_type:complete
MAVKVSEETEVQLSLKSIVAVVVLAATLVGMWYTLKAEIEIAKILPEPEISRMEYQMKDELIRSTILNTQEDVTEMKGAITRIEDKLYDR